MLLNGPPSVSCSEMLVEGSEIDTTSCAHAPLAFARAWCTVRGGLTHSTRRYGPDFSTATSPGLIESCRHIQLCQRGYVHLGSLRSSSDVGLYATWAVTNVLGPRVAILGIFYFYFLTYIILYMLLTHIIWQIELGWLNNSGMKWIYHRVYNERICSTYSLSWMLQLIPWLPVPVCIEHWTLRFTCTEY